MDLKAIAKERGLTPQTIVSHIARYVTSGELKATDFVDTQKAKIIRGILKTISPEDGIKNIKDACPSGITYSDITFILAEEKREKQEESKNE